VKRDLAQLLVHRLGQAQGQNPDSSAAQRPFRLDRLRHALFRRRGDTAGRLSGHPDLREKPGT
jgi:hypothetical protein